MSHSCSLATTARPNSKESLIWCPIKNFASLQQNIARICDSITLEVSAKSAAAQAHMTHGPTHLIDSRSAGPGMPSVPKADNDDQKGGCYYGEGSDDDNNNNNNNNNKDDDGNEMSNFVIATTV